MRRAARAQSLPLLALLLVPLLGFAALGTDAAYLYAQRRLTQNAADAAALAGARELLARAATDSQVVLAATTYAAANGFPPPVPTDSISIIRPDTVRVRLERSVSLFFLPVLGTDSLRIAARATARIIQAPGEYALLALEDLITDPGIYANGTTDIYVLGRGPSGRGASVRSNAAIDTRGTVTFIVDGCIDALLAGSTRTAPGNTTVSTRSWATMSPIPSPAACQRRRTARSATTGAPIAPATPDPSNVGSSHLARKPSLSALASIVDCSCPATSPAPAEVDPARRHALSSSPLTQAAFQSCTSTTRPSSSAIPTPGSKHRVSSST